jgi:regulator of sigma E protease
MAVIAAGVVFNAVGAVLIFMALFMNGINLKPAVVGHVMQNSPAYDAGLRSGDRIVEINGDAFEINGKRCVDFETIFQAPLLSASGESIAFVINRNGTEKEISLVAEKKAGDVRGLRFSGLLPANRLQVSRYFADPNSAAWLYDNFQLCRGDIVKSVHGQAVQTPWDYKAVLAKTFQAEVELGVSRLQREAAAAASGDWPESVDPDGERTMTTVSYPMDIAPTVENFRDEFDLTHFGSLVPRLKVAGISTPTRTERFIRWVRTAIFQKADIPTAADVLKTGDILIQVGSVNYPNFKQLRELTTTSKDTPLPMTVLRRNSAGVQEAVEVRVTPQAHRGSGRVTVGFFPALDLDTPVVAQSLSVPSMSGDVPKIPGGATVTAVNGQPVGSYFEIAAAMQAAAGEKIDIAYRLDATEDVVSVTVPEHEPVHAEAYIKYAIPFDEYTRNYRASNPLQAVGMGFKKVSQFVVRNYITLGRLFQKDVPMSALSGPVGIISMTYQVTGASVSRYLYFLGLISSALAVMNLLPLPVLDGGHIVLLLIEKITGRPVHERVLAPVMYIGLALLLGLVLWVSYNDIIRLLF